uniref:Ion transport domain-containing protein n=1 Tax=Hemiselmis andersenii TaxID=464988 RepID=A0A7S1E5W3_HEMAN
MPCKWLPDTTDPDLTATSGKCKMMLYSATNFAERAEVGSLGNFGKISLRHLCGDDGSLCGTSDAALSSTLEDINLVLTYIFIAEMGLKMLGLGLVDYFSERFNQFDFLVVMTSIVDVVVTAQSAGGGTSTGVSSLRGMRLLRLFKLARSWSSMRKILNTLGIALGNLKALTIVWGMFMYIFALLCMQFCGGYFKFVKTENPRSNFDSFGPSSTGHGAFLIVFQIISTENWNTILYNSMQIGGGSPEYSFITIGIVLFGNYIIMNLFISILLQGFDEDDETIEDTLESADPKPQVGPAQQVLNKFKVLIGKGGASSARIQTEDNNPHPMMFGDDLSKLAFAAANKAHLDSIVPEEDRDDGKYKRMHFKPFDTTVRLPAHNSFGLLPPHNYVRVLIAALTQHKIFERIILVSILVTSILLIIEHPAYSWIGDASQCPRAPAVLDCRGLLPGQTEWINCPRDGQGELYERCDSPNVDKRPECCWIANQQEVFGILDKIFTIIFLCEMLLKMVADGLIMHEHAYLRNAWNWLDFIVVVISVISSFLADYLGSGSGSLKTLKTLRTIRVLRPLRVIKRHPGLRVAVVCLISSMPAMGNVVVVVFVWFSMWAMFGVQMFKGQLYRCYDYSAMVWYGASWFPGGSLYTATPTMSGEQAVPTIVECVNAGNSGGVGAWTDKPYSFNNYLTGLLTVFEMATTEGWMDVMAAVVDATGNGVTPIPNHNPWASMYCAFHIVVGAFVLLNLIVGSVINNYNRVKALNQGVTPFTTPEQQEWKETQRIIYNLKPITRKQGPKNPLRQYCFQMVQNDRFELVVTGVIVLNVMSLMTRHHNQSLCWTTTMFWANVVFLMVFVGEAIIKLLALGPRWYFVDPWNMFDFVVVLLSCVMLIVDSMNGDWTCAQETGQNINVPALSMLRVFRIARVFRLVRRLKGLRQMIETLIISLPSLSNIALLIVVIIIIFSVLCVTFFYNVNIDQDAYGSMSGDANYESFDRALWLLHRQTTGEAWNTVMAYCSRDDPYLACAKAYPPYLGDGCGGLASSIPIHVFWQLFGTYTMMQLFTAVIIENFHELAKGGAFVLPMHKLSEFVDIWTELDPEAEQAIDVSLIPTLIMKLPPPLGLAGKNPTPSTLMQVIKDLAIPIRDGKVSYKETFVACVKRVMDHDIEDEEEEDEEEDGPEGKVEAKEGGGRPKLFIA